MGEIPYSGHDETLARRRRNDRWSQTILLSNNITTNTTFNTTTTHSIQQKHIQYNNNTFNTTTTHSTQQQHFQHNSANKTSFYTELIAQQYKLSRNSVITLAWWEKYFRCIWDRAVRYGDMNMAVIEMLTEWSIVSSYNNKRYDIFTFATTTIKNIN